MNKEEWRDVPGTEGCYKISSMGRLWRLSRSHINSRGQKRTIKEKIWLGTISKCGYYRTTINYCGTISFSGNIHQLVAMVFLNHKKCGLGAVVDHINHNKLDNRVENLRVISHRENIGHTSKETASKYPGVWFHKGSKQRPWATNIYVNGKNKYIGTFKTEKEAHMAYQNELKKLK